MLYDVNIKALVEIGRRLYDRSLVVAAQGNLSIKTDDNRIIITSSGSCLGTLKERDFAAIDAEGNHIGKIRPSSEYRIHLTAYSVRPEIGACCHAHPPFASAFGVTDTELPRPFLPETVLTVGPIAVIDYVTPGTDLLAKKLAEFMPAHNAFILRNHGVLTLGTDPLEAFYRMEIVENMTRIAYIARTLGTINSLDSEEIRRLGRIGKSLESNRSADDQKSSTR